MTLPVNPTNHFYIKYNVIERKRVGRDCVFLWLAGLPLGISLGLRPREIPWGSPVSPWKTQSLPPLFLTIYNCFDMRWHHLPVVCWQ